MPYISPKIVRRIFFAVWAVALLLVLIGAFTAGVTLPIVGAGIGILGSLFYLLWYRCPHCGRFLGRTWGNFCSYCGKKIDE